MKTILVMLAVVGFVFSVNGHADGYYAGFGWGGHHRHHHHGHHYGHGFGYAPPQRYYREQVIYAVPPPVQYYAPPPVVTYYPPQPPPVQYYQEQRPQHYNQPSGQGLMGGVVGSALGYQMGRGDPVAAGLGAAAGAFVGNRW